MRSLPRISCGLFLLPVLALCQPSLLRAEEDVEELYKKVVRSSVFIVTQEPGGFSMGSGTLVDVEKRIVITNFHVVGEQNSCYCQFPVYLKDGSMLTDKEKYLARVKVNDAIKADVLYKDSSRDLAILKLKSVPAGTPALPLSVKGAGIGGTVWNIGSPGAVNQVFGITEGKVRSIGIKEYLTGGGNDAPFAVKAKIVTTSNPTNPGDSGGPLFNKFGEMVGVTQGGSTKANLVSLFIDVSEVKSFLDEKKIVIKVKDPVSANNPKAKNDSPDSTETPKVEPKTGTTPPAKDVSKDEKAASALLSAAKAYSKDEDLRAKYVAKLNEIITKYPNTAAAKDAKRLLDGLK